MNSVLVKGHLALAINEKPKLKLIFMSLINRFLSSFQMTFRSFFLLVRTPITKKKKSQVG